MSSKRRPTGGNQAALHAALHSAIGLAFVVPAAAQPAPNARPLGGQVVAGSAAIAAGSTTTTINQSTNRAAIDWRSFNVGSNQSVIFNQPGANSVTLNRVTGPDPSAIAGRISANGQLVLTNPSGVVFHAGSQVNAQSVIVSAPGITNQNFMAGRMVFDQAANPNARIENAGTITVKQAGLAALVAPSVANSGTITARMGHVVLAGAAAHTIDMYGDGLVSIDVTKQVTQAPVGPGGKSVTALVTNSGTIEADGGTVQLTARAADGVVNTLVQAGGRIQANTLGGRAGQIEIAGTGGSVVIEGRVAADGRAPGTTGGSVMVAGSDATVVAPTARVSANGRAGGGTVAVGTTLARARSSGPAPAGTSARTVVAAGARISADATAKGDGGRVTVLSTQSTDVAGTLTAKGGRTAGDGGTVELSGETGFRLTGKADTSAPHGALGTVVLDPRDLTVTNAPGLPTTMVNDETDPRPNLGYDQGGTMTDAYVTQDQLENLRGNIYLQASRDLIVASSFATGGNGVPGSLKLEAGRNLTIDSGVTITVVGTASRPGVTTLTAAASNIPGYDPAGTLTILGNIRTSSLVLSAGTGGIVLGGTLDTTYVTTSGAINATRLTSPGAVTQSGGALLTGDLNGIVGSLSLTSTTNQIAGAGRLFSPLVTTAGGVAIVDAAALAAGSSGAASSPNGIVVPTGQTISLTTNSLTLASGSPSVPALSAPGGTVILQPFSTNANILITSAAVVPGSEPPQLALTTAEVGLIRASTLQLGLSTANSGNITLGNANESIDLTSLGIGALALQTAGAITQGGPLTVASLSITAGINSGVTLTNSANQIGALSNLGGNDGIAVYTAGNLNLGTVGVDDATISAGGSITQTAGTLSSSFGLSLNAGALGGISLGGASNIASTFSLTAGTGGVTLSGSVRTGFLQVTTTGALTQGGGSLSADTLSGNASLVSLPSRGNSLTSVRGFGVTGGDFLLVDNTPVTIAPPIGSMNAVGLTLSSGRTATVVTDYLSITRGGTSTGSGISASGGTLVVAPYTVGGAVLLTSGAKPANGLSLTTSELALVDAASLQLGGAGGLPMAGAITVGQGGDAAIDLGALGFTRLTLNATGAVTQNAPLGVTTLAGTAGSVALADAGNFITALDGLGATAGDIALHTSSGLTVSGAVGATGNVTLSSEDAMVLAANLSGGTVRLDTTDGNGVAHAITQTAGILTAGTLTGVADTAQFTQANQITDLGDFATVGNLTVGNGRALTLTGAVSSSGGAVTLNARGITQTPTSSITTAELDGSSNADTVLDSRRNAVSGMGYFNQTSGDFTLVTASPELDFGRNSGNVTATAGSLTFVADRVGLVTNPATGTSVSANAGLVAFAPFTAGRPIALAGSAIPANTLALSTNFLSYVHADTLTLGRAGYAGAISFGAANEQLNFSAFRAIQVQTTGAVTQGLNSTWTVSSLYGTAGSISLPGALPGNNNVSTLGLGLGGAPVGLTATAGPLTVGTIANLTTYGPVSATTAVTLSTGRAGLSIVGSVSAPTVTLLAGGGVSEASAGQISTDTLTITAGSVSLLGTNRIGTLTSIVSGDLSLSSAAGLTIAGGSTIGGTLTLNVAGAVTAGTLSAQALTGRAGSLSLTDPNNRFGSLGPFTTTGGFTLVDAVPLTVTGTVSDPGAIALSVAGDLTLAGSLSSPQGAVRLNATGSINQTGGAITAASLTGSAGGSAIFGQAGNAVATLAGFTTGNDFTLVDGRSLVVSAPVDPNTVTMTVRGDLTLASSVTGGTVVLNATGALTEAPGGRIVADTLTARASSAALGGDNRIATLGAVATTTGFSLANSGALTVAGPVTDGRAVAISNAGSLTLAGDVSAPAVAFNVAGDLTQTGGSLAAGSTLTVSATGALTQLGGGFAAGSLSASAASIDIGQGGAASIAAITGLVATGSSPGSSNATIALRDIAPLQVSGTVSGRFVSITATGSLVLADGTAIRTDGQPTSAQLGASDASFGSNLAVLAGPDGRATLTQLGTVTVAPLSAAAATLRLDLPARNGTIALRNLQAGNADLVFNLGTGVATGTLVARNLTVLGTGGQATLAGTIRGLSGTDAAAGASLLPGVDPRYTLNGCGIALANCSGIAGIVSIVTPGTITPLDVPSIFQPGAAIDSLIASASSAISSVIRPDILALDVLDLSVTRDRDDPTLLLPNISDKDY